MKRLKRNPKLQDSRAAFSLIELLIVIVVIAVLIGLLLPAINGVRLSIRAGETKTEITQLSSAIASFKSQYNVEPPSYLAIPASDPSDTAAVEAEWNTAAYAPSKRLIRQIWGRRFDFGTNGGLGNAGPVVLTGPECIVFFLGGVRVWDDSMAGGGNEDGLRDANEVGAAIVGFSSNPTRPFDVDAGTRNGPFFEFKQSRLVDLDGDGAYEYLDTIPGQVTPYMYLSSYDGSGYQAPDLVFFGNVSQDMLSPYMQGEGVPWKNKSFQIISPGFDFTYGTGGFYTPGIDMAQTLFDPDLPLQPDPSLVDYNPVRLVETDNITNFSEGTELN